MNIGFIGLGKMGTNMILNLAEHNKVVIYNRSPSPTKRLAKKRNIIATYNLEDLFKKTKPPRTIWIMITAGRPVDEAIKSISPYLKKGDTIIDGGNSYFKDSVRRNNILKKQNINFLDVGVSGGVGGARHGASMMIGGDQKVFKKNQKMFQNMCVKNGYGYVGRSGAGHFTKGIHNAIEYGMLGAIGEGMQALSKSPKKFNLDLKTILGIYSNGTIIEGKLIRWLNDGFNKRNITQTVGRVPKGFTENEMKELGKNFDMPVLHSARLMREKSRKKSTYAGKIISIIRNQFGGHEIYKK